MVFCFHSPYSSISCSISLKWIQLSLINSQIDLLRSQTALIKGNAKFPILEIAMAIPASRKSALTLTLRILTSHDEKLMNYSG